MFTHPKEVSLAALPLHGLFDQKAHPGRPEVLCFLSLGVDIYLGNGVQSSIAIKQKSGRPSREALLSEARIRGLEDLTQGKFDIFWNSIHRYHGDLAVYARYHAWRSNVLTPTTGVLKEKLCIVRSDVATLPDVIEEVCIAYIAQRLARAGMTVSLQGLLGQEQHRKSILLIEKKLYELGMATWRTVYQQMADAAGIRLTSDFLDRFSLHAALLSEGYTKRAYINQELEGIPDSEIADSFGRRLGFDLICYVRGLVVDLDQKLMKVLTLRGKAIQ
ncbi:hypothetical protein [Micromonospora sp. RL09-050-HVF-A]|uniref:hypothetical protein n=1 Tax=Micromonospora sp. RL09-050-HVF-A TaxID=1703433 RepID=UPI001C5CEDAB|nr:hypothetical protein [Micromonospora sp. RL09-050-HVF-A]MBW4704042.1 hypothetical protein [Micromonospora sp. RL09-050-HVF-A]